MFDTCTMRCGYCWFAESGQVLDFEQLKPFGDPVFLEKITKFFLTRTTADTGWRILLTGGEPLIAPNLERLLAPLIEAGNRIAFYTALLVGRDHPGFRFLRENSSPQVEYIMASFHPEAEANEPQFFEKIKTLRDAGHKVFLRFVGHPQRLHRLQELSDRCRELDICFYPTTLMSNNYPGAYTPRQRRLLGSHFSSLSQHIQLEGGLDTTNLICHAGSRVISINLQTGHITPCITVHSPLIGNIFEDRLELQQDPIRCPEPGIDCICDIHFQQDIVIAAEDSARFHVLSNGFVPPENFQPHMDALREKGVEFYRKADVGLGAVDDDSRLFYTIDEVRENFRKARGLPRTTLNRQDLREIAGAVQEIQPAGASNKIEPGPPIRIVTPAARWSYAAAIPLTIPEDLAGEVWVRVRATVMRGQAGFGLLNRTGTEYQDRSFIAADMEAHTVFLRIADIADLQSLVIENSSGDGDTEILLREVVVLAATGSSSQAADLQSESPAATGLPH